MLPGFCPQHRAHSPQDLPRSPRQGQAPSLDVRAWAQPWESRTERKTRLLVLVLSACGLSPQEQEERRSRRQSSRPQGLTVYTVRKARGTQATGTSQSPAPSLSSCMRGKLSSTPRTPCQ